MEAGERPHVAAAIGKRLALIASFAPSLTQFRAELIRDVCAAGHRVLCLAPDFDDRTRATVERLGAETGDYPLQRTGLNPLADLASLKALERRLGDWRPDVVCGYTLKPAIYASIAARRAGVPRIVPMITGLGYAFLPARGLKAMAARAATRLLLRLALRHCDAAIFHNADDRGLLAQHGLLPRTLPTHVVSGSGVNLARYPQAPLHSFEGGLVFLMVARLVRYKGVVEYCRAAQSVIASGGRARFLLVGPEERGPAGITTEELKGYGAAVEHLGPRRDVAELMGRAHVYVLPSYGEGMPRTALEALSVGRPVITTDARGCRETVEEGVNGFLVPVGDAEALAEAMQRMLRRPDLIPQMAAASRVKAEQRFDVQLVNAAMRAALELG